jgi:enamine deaminase RidA (YjgF/YER057c/UK114 family)
MSHLQYFSYPGVGERNRQKFKYNQAVRIGDRIECAGQGEPLFYFTNASRTETYVTGGWDRETGEFYKEINAQIDQAFANVEANLKHAGGDGWSQVFRVNSYHVPINNEALEAMVRNFRKYMPNHEPIWTCVGVSRLGEDDMRVEIEVVAHVPN